MPYADEKPMSNANGDDHLSEEEVLEILINPIYTRGSNPTVTDEYWIVAQKTLIDEQGLDTYLLRLLALLKQTFGDKVQ